MSSALTQAALLDKDKKTICTCDNKTKSILVALLLIPDAVYIRRTIKDTLLRSEFIDRNFMFLGVEPNLSNRVVLLNNEFNKIMVDMFGKSWRTVLSLLGDRNKFARDALNHKFKSSTEMYTLITNLKRLGNEDENET